MLDQSALHRTQSMGFDGQGLSYFSAQRGLLLRAEVCSSLHWQSFAFQDRAGDEMAAAGCREQQRSRVCCCTACCVPVLLLLLPPACLLLLLLLATMNAGV